MVLQTGTVFSISEHFPGTLMKKCLTEGNTKFNNKKKEKHRKIGVFNTWCQHLQAKKKKNSTCVMTIR